MPSPLPRVGTKGVPRVEREAQIVDAASREFAAAGYAGASMSAVARAAGISKPLVYQYFGSKEGLAVACLEHAGSLLGGEIEEVAASGAVGIDRGVRTLAAMFAVLDDRRHLWRLLHDRTAPTEGPVADVVGRQGARLTELALEGVGELLRLAGDPDPVDASALAAAWLGIVDALMDWWLEHPEESADAMTERCLRVVGALFATPGGGPA